MHSHREVQLLQKEKLMNSFFMKRTSRSILDCFSGLFFFFFLQVHTHVGSYVLCKGLRCWISWLHLNHFWPPQVYRFVPHWLSTWTLKSRCSESSNILVWALIVERLQILTRKVKSKYLSKSCEGYIIQRMLHLTTREVHSALLKLL